MTRQLTIRTTIEGTTLHLENEPGHQPRTINVTDVVNYVGSFKKGSPQRLFAGDYSDWMLKAQQSEPNPESYPVSPRIAVQIRMTIDFLLSQERKIFA